MTTATHHTSWQQQHTTPHDHTSLHAYATILSINAMKKILLHCHWTNSSRNQPTIFFRDMSIRNTAIRPGPIVYVSGGTFLTCQFHETCHGGHRRGMFQSLSSKTKNLISLQRWKRQTNLMFQTQFDVFNFTSTVSWFCIILPTSTCSWNNLWQYNLY